MDRFNFGLLTIPKPDAAAIFDDQVSTTFPDISIDPGDPASIVLNSYGATGISRAYCANAFLYEVRSRASAVLGQDFAVGIGRTYGDTVRQAAPETILVVFSPQEGVSPEILGLQVVVLDLEMLDALTRLQIANGLDSTLVTRSSNGKFALTYDLEGELAFRVVPSPDGVPPSVEFSSILGVRIV